MQVDRDGVIMRMRVTRNLPVSDEPLMDGLRALLDGPSESEEQRGLISLVPQGVRVNNMIIRGGTAYLNLNEEFQFNTYGVEGYMGSLRQVVWTVTESSGVNDVQILIDGRRVDYLGESIWIGGPLSRDSLQ
jgi:spore germination protein GerM